MGWIFRLAEFSGSTPSQMFSAIISGSTGFSFQMSANSQVAPLQVAQGQQAQVSPQGQQAQVAPQLPLHGQGLQQGDAQFLSLAGQPQVIPGGFQPQDHAQQGQQLPGYFTHQQAQNYIGQDPQFNQGGGQGAYNAILNNKFAMHRAMWAQQQAVLAMQQCEGLKKAHGRAERWSRDLRISQEQGK